MQDVPKPPPPTLEHIEQMKPKGGFVLLGAPIVGIVVVFALYAWLLFNGWIGKPATGPQVTYAVQGCAEAAQVMQGRIEEMGLAPATITAVPGGFELSVGLPTAETDPGTFGQTLGARGHFAMRAGDQVLATHEHVVSAGVRMDLTMTPATLVVLDEVGTKQVYAWMNGSPDARTQMDIDGVEVWSFHNQKTTTAGEFEIHPSAEDDQSRMELAASRGIILARGPLPCDVQIQPKP